MNGGDNSFDSINETGDDEDVSVMTMAMVVGMMAVMLALRLVMMKLWPSGSDNDGSDRDGNEDDVKGGGDTTVDGDDSNCGDGALVLVVVTAVVTGG